MEYKKAKIYIDSKEYIYTIKGGEYYKKIIVYLSGTKITYFITYISYVENWGFNVYSPKTIEILIRFYNENCNSFKVNEFKLLDYPELFQLLLENHFEGCSKGEKEQFCFRCFEWYNKEIVMTDM